MGELLELFKPDAVSIEELFFNTNITTGIAVAHARGVILCAAEKHKLPIYEYTPMQVKQAVVGYGLAEKKQVMDMTRTAPRSDSINPKPTIATPGSIPNMRMTFLRLLNISSIIAKPP